MAEELIEKIVERKRKEAYLYDLLKREFKGRLISKVVYYDTPLGEKVIIYCANPRLVLGRANENVEKIINLCKKYLGFKNPNVEAIAVENPLLDPEIVADLISYRIEKFGTRAARRIMIDIAQKVIEAGARGIEIRITGKVIGEKSQTIRYQLGKIKKAGELNKIFRKAVAHAKLPSGVVGVQVRILPENVKISDNVRIKEISELSVDEIKNLDPEILEKLQKKLEKI